MKITKLPPIGGTSSVGSGDNALVRRAESDIDRRQPKLAHEHLSARASSMPRDVSHQPRGGLPLHGQNSPLRETEAMYQSHERSDRFSSLSIQRSSYADWGSEFGSNRLAEFDSPNRTPVAVPAAEPPAERSWRATIAAPFTTAGALLSRAGGALGQAAATTGGAIGQAAATAGGVIGQAATTASGVLGRATTTAGYVAGRIANELGEQVSSLTLLNPGTKLAGAAAGHLIHQSITVGVPTFVREMMADAMMLSMRHIPATHAVALQTAMGAVSIGAQAMRRYRENRNPDAAARGFHAMTQPQWDALSDEGKALKRSEQQKHSRMVFNLQVVASATHIGVGLLAARADKPQPELSSQLFVTDFKAMVYSGMRDSLQATFSMVDTGDTPGGVSGTHMIASAKFYALANAVGNHAFSYLPGSVSGAATAHAVLRGENDTMTIGEAWLTKATVAGVKAAINTAVESADWFSVTQHEVDQAGSVQKWGPQLKVLDPAKRDYGRLLDQTPARMTAIGAGNAIFNGMGFALRDKPEWMRVGLTNMVEAAYEGLKYKSIGGTWQANGAVRSAPAPTPTPTPTNNVRIEELQGPDLEAGHHQG